MGIESRDFIHFDQRQVHQIGQSQQMARGEAVIAVLDRVQMLDQEIAIQPGIT